MAERSIRLVTTMGRPVDVVIMPHGPDGMPFRWRSGAYDVDVAEADAIRLLDFLSQHYPLRDAVPMRPTEPALVVRVSVLRDFADKGRGIAEATRLLGIAMGRLSNGDLTGEVSDVAGVRRVQWRLG